MLKDPNRIINNLLEFYDFKDKILLSVGAGGGQFIAYARFAKHVIAVDNDSKALKTLAQKIKNQHLEDKFTLIHSDFMNIKEKADVILFEFCLHEMDNHQKVLNHAKKLSRDIIISDHDIKSEWAYIGNETEKSIISWNIISKNIVIKKRQYSTIQTFNSYNDLYNRIKEQGDISINRIKIFKNKKDIEIIMRYNFALL